MSITFCVTTSIALVAIAVPVFLSCFDEGNPKKRKIAKRLVKLLVLAELAVLLGFWVSNRGFTQNQIFNPIKTGGITASDDVSIEKADFDAYTPPKIHGFRAGKENFFYDGKGERITDPPDLRMYDVTIKSNILINYKEIKVHNIYGGGFRIREQHPGFFELCINAFQAEKGEFRVTKGIYKLSIKGFPDKYIWVDQDGVYSIYYTQAEIRDAEEYYS